MAVKCNTHLSARFALAGSSTKRYVTVSAGGNRGQKYYENFLKNREKRGGRYLDILLDDGLVGDPKVLDAMVDQLLTTCYQAPLVHYNGPGGVAQLSRNDALVTKPDISSQAGDGGASIPAVTSRRSQLQQQQVAADRPAKGRKGITIDPPDVTPPPRQYPLPPLPYRNRLATSAQLYLFWNIDNKHPGGVDPRALCHHLRSILGHYGSVEGIYGYAAKKTWNPVPPALLEKYGTSAKGTKVAPGVFRCPICQLDLPSFDKLRTHTKTLHNQDLLQRSVLNKTLLAAGRSTALGNVAYYHNSAGQAFEPQYGLMLSLKYVLLREGVDVRSVNNAKRDVTSAINKGIEGLVEKLSEGAVQADRQQVVVVVADSDGHAPVLRWCRGLGISTVVVCQDVLVRRGADVTLRWPWMRTGTYCGVECGQL